MNASLPIMGIANAPATMFEILKRLKLDMKSIDTFANGHRIAMAGMLLMGLALQCSCGLSDRKSAAEIEVENATPLVQSLKRHERLEEWIQFADQLSTNATPLEKLLVFPSANGPGRLLTAIDGQSYEAAKGPEMLWQNGFTGETVANDTNTMLSAEVEPILKALTKHDLTGFDRGVRGGSVSLSVTPNVILVVFPASGDTRGLEYYEGDARKGEDPRGDIVIKINARVFGKTLRR